MFTNSKFKFIGGNENFYFRYNNHIENHKKTYKVLNFANKKLYYFINEKIYFWSPCLSKNVGTYKSTINSAISLSKYSKGNYSVKVINVCGEWDDEKELLKKIMSTYLI